MAGCSCLLVKSPNGDRVCCSLNRLQFVLFFVFSLLISSICLTIWLPGYISSQLSSGIDDYVFLTPEAQQGNSDAWKAWEASQPDTPTYYSIYPWNITNTQEILAGGKPQLVQTGPYTFLQTTIHLNPTFSRDLSSGLQLLSSQEYIYYTFMPDMSSGDLSDTIISLNLPFQILHEIQHQLETLVDILDQDFFLMFSKCFSSDTNEYNRDRHYTDETRFFSSLSIQQLAFGYSDPSLVNCSLSYIEEWNKKHPKSLLQVPEALAESLNNIPGLVGNQSMADALAKPPDSIYMDKNAPYLLRKYYKWHGLQYLAGSSPLYPFVWGTSAELPDAAAVNRLCGNDGLQFQPSLAKDQKLEVFIESLVRCVYLAPEGSVDYQGISLQHYILDPLQLLNVSMNPLNKLYSGTNFDGLFNEGPAYTGLPVFATKPHFLDTDKRIQQQFLGLSPNPEIHETFLDIEPITGATMHAHKRLQLNLFIQPLKPDLLEEWGKNLRENLYFPLLWLDEAGGINGKDIDAFKSSVYLANSLLHWIPIVGTIFCCFFTCLLIFIHYSIQRYLSQQYQSISLLNDVYTSSSVQGSLDEKLLNGQ